MTESDPRPRYIAIEGPIGVGKSTLAGLLADSMSAHFLRDTEVVNPYLDDFYRDPSRVALHTQLHFLVSRLNALQNPMVQRPTSSIVSDFLIDKDRLFAELALNEQEWWMYTQLHDRVVRDLPAPDLVIYLQAPLERLIERIERRGHKREKRIDSQYLQRLIALYERFFHDYTDSPLLIVNAADINIADNPADVERLLARIADVEAGRHYYNPAATA